MSELTLNGSGHLAPQRRLGSDSEAVSYLERYERMRSVDSARDALVQELIAKVDLISGRIAQLQLDKAREEHFNRDGQLREMSLLKKLDRWDQYEATDNYVVVLIDGDGAIFQDHLLREGEQGGKEAAQQLFNEVRRYIALILGALPSHANYQIVTKIYANLQGLGEVCRKAGIVDRGTKLTDFARGFTQGKTFFDFTDVGGGKERTDKKVADLLGFYLKDCHCRHLLLGCSHDNGYARILEDIQSEPLILRRISLMEGVPFERELRPLTSHFRTTKFEKLFRERKISVEQHSHSDFRPESQPFTPSYSLPPAAVMRTSSAMLPDGVTISSSPVPQTWATAANNTTGGAGPTGATPSQVSVREIARNRKGERIDSELKFDKYDVKRIRSMRMCNTHYLRGDCGYNTNCTHDHDYKPSKTELTTLRYVVRAAPCRFRPDCDDPKCMYGHHCPNGKGCSRDINCKFEDEEHEMDMQPIKTVKV